MNIKPHLAFILLFSSPLAVSAADKGTTRTTFVDDAPAGFVHISEIYSDSTEKHAENIYIKASTITSVSICDLSKDQKTEEIYLWVATSELHSTDVSKPAKPRGYSINYKTTKDAEMAARRIMGIVRQAEQAGADQPATKPADKPPVENQPSTPTPKDAPPVAGGRPLTLCQENQIQMARYELQEPRLYADFNGYFGAILCLSHGDTCKTKDGDEVIIREGMIVTAYDEDANDAGDRDDLIATGVVERSPESLRCRGSVWCLRIDENCVRSESEIHKSEEAEHVMDVNRP